MLIVGIDPGVTLGYAVIDIEGNLMRLRSSKQLDLNSVISETTALGRVVLVGTDKAKIPSLIEAFAAKVGARIVSPQEDIKVEEKKSMTRDFDLSDEHQRDALASALFAYKSTKSLLDKINRFIDEYKKYGIKNKIKELVITKKISIRAAASLIEKKDEETQITEKVISEKKVNENDFLKLYDKLKKYEAEIKLIKIYNNNLRNRVENLEKNRIGKLNNHNTKLDFQANKIINLEEKIRNKDNYIEQLKSSIKRLSSLISKIDDFYILKKLETFGISEFNLKSKIINMKKNDILLVTNPNVVSNSVIDLLKDKIILIVHKKPISKKIEDNLPFLFISASSLKITEDKYFGFVEKRHFDIEKNRINWISKSVENYKKERAVNLLDNSA